MKHKVCFIVPYFGCFPATFQLWLNCCKNNPLFDWLIITDNNQSYEYPSNVHVSKTTFESLRIHIDEKMGFETGLSTPYKLCDFKPLYGFLFEDKLKKYTHWGHIDIDLFFGQLDKFYTEELLESYDKISVLGHLCIYKNQEQINYCFKKCDYMPLFKDSRIKVFDEVRFSPNINELLRDNGFKVLNSVTYADLGVEHYPFWVYNYLEGNRSQVVSTLPTIFEYKDGALYEVCIKNDCIEKKELAYVHFQKRKITVKNSLLENFLLVPNYVIPFRELNVADIKKYAKEKWFYYIKQRYLRLKRAIVSRTKK